MKIFIANDHGGIHIKSDLINYLKKRYKINKKDIIDFGTFSDASVNYATIAKSMIKEFIKDINNNNLSPIEDPTNFGILICSSGIGVSIAANRYNEIRAALCHNEEYAKMSRMHNNSNILCIGAKYTTLEEIQKISTTFIDTKFEGGRHIPRVCSLSSNC